jgi:hypothetical protein
VQGGHPPLPLGTRRPLDGLGPLDRRRVKPVEQPLRLSPVMMLVVAVKNEMPARKGRTLRPPVKYSSVVRWRREKW